MANSPNPVPGWYRDPAGQPRRRYWDGQDWTDEYAEPEIANQRRPVSPVFDYFAAGGFLVVGLVIVVGGVVSSNPLLGGLGVSVTAASWFCWWTLGGVKRRRRRQQASDRARALAINGEREHRAYLHGDEKLGMYGQFPPPPELLGDR